MRSHGSSKPSIPFGCRPYVDSGRGCVLRAERIPPDPLPDRSNIKRHSAITVFEQDERGQFGGQNVARAGPQGKPPSAHDRSSLAATDDRRHRRSDRKVVSLSPSPTQIKKIVFWANRGNLQQLLPHMGEDFRCRGGAGVGHGDKVPSLIPYYPLIITRCADIRDWRASRGIHRERWKLTDVHVV